MIVRTSFVLSGLALVGVAIVLYGLVRGVMGWTVTGMHLLFLCFWIGLRAGVFLEMEKLVGLYDWLIFDSILSLHDPLILPQDQLLRRQILQLLMGQDILLQLFLDLSNDQMFGEVGMQEVALGVMLEVFIDPHHSVLEVSEKQLA